MNIIDMIESTNIGPGNFFVDIDEGPIAVIIAVKENDEEMIDEYDLIYEYVKLEEANGGCQVSREDEYSAFVKWLESHEDFETIYMTEQLRDFFNYSADEEGYIDEDGMFKFYDDDSDDNE